MRAPETELVPTAAVDVTFGSLLPVASIAGGLLSTLHAYKPARIRKAEVLRTPSIISSLLAVSRRLYPGIR